jgi:hypothetical protein
MFLWDAACSGISVLQEHIFSIFCVEPAYETATRHIPGAHNHIIYCHKLVNWSAVAATV